MVDGPVAIHESTVPSRGSGEPTRGSATNFVRAEIWLLAAGFLLRAWVLTLGFFRLDDWVYMSSAVRLGFSQEYLLQDYNGHLMPFKLALVWITTTLVPLNFFAATLPVLAILAVATLLTWQVLKILVPAGWVRLFAVVILSFSPLTLEALPWLAAALETIPLQMCLAGAMLGTVKSCLGAKSGIPMALGFLVIGLGFWEKSLIIAPVIVGMVWVLWVRGLLSNSRFKELLVTYGVALLAVCGTYIWWYMSLVSDRASGWMEGLSMLPASWVEGIFGGLAPMLPGGPWRSSAVALDPLADPSPWAIALGVAIAALAVGASVALNRRKAVAAWVVVAAYISLEVVVARISKGDEFGALLLRDPRYYADALPVILVFGALAFTPFDSQALSTKWRLPAWARQPVVPAIVLALYVMSCFVTAWGKGQAAHANPARSFVGTARAEIAELGYPILFDGDVPDRLVPYTYPGPVSRLLVTEKDIKYDRPAAALYTLNSDGNVIAAEVGNASDSYIGPVPGCGWVVKGPPVAIPLSNSLFDWVWGVRISYLAQESVSGTVAMGDKSYPVQFQKGPHEVFLVHRGEPTPVSIATDDSNVALCINQVRVGDVRPKDNNADNG